MLESNKLIRSFFSIFIACALAFSLVPSVALATAVDESVANGQQFCEANDTGSASDALEVEEGKAANDEPNDLSDDAQVLAAEDPEAPTSEDPAAIFDVAPADLEGDFAPDELIIVYEDEMIDQRDQLDLAEIEATVTLEDLGIAEQEEIVDDADTDTSGDIVLAKLDDETTVEEAVSRLEQVPGVAYVQPNYEYKMAASPATNDELVNEQYYLTSSRVTDAWKYKKVSKSVTVAVIDSGCNLDHPDLKDNLLVDLAWDCVAGKTLASQKTSIGYGGDNNGHGTMVSGVIAAEADNNEGIAGVSYNAKILPLRVMSSSGTTYTNYIIAALQKIEDYIKAGKVSNLKVVNMSLGGYSNDPSLHASIQRMRNVYGLTLVCAGGNGDRATGQPITAPCYPSDYDECIAVTSLTENGEHSYWSDYNPSKDISAPGEDIVTTSNKGGYVTTAGSSFSAPIVAGVASLIFAACPDATPNDVYNALRETAGRIYGTARPYNGSAGAVNAIGALAYMGVDTSATYSWVPSYESYYSPVYSYLFYRGAYADIRSVFGYNRRQILNHFLNNGMAEGRKATASFEVASYYNANPDVRAAFGTNVRAITMHYVTNGKREGRTCLNVPQLQGFASTYAGTSYSPVYDGKYYHDTYADLRSAFTVRAAPNVTLFDDQALLRHFVNADMAEGRKATASFDVASYYNANPDLRAAFGTNVRNLTMHYVSYGKRENRKATGVSQLQGFTSTYAGTSYSPVYDGEYYYDNHADLRSAFTVRAAANVTLFDDAALLRHFVSWGMTEGRRASSSFDVASYYNANPDLRAAFGTNVRNLTMHYVGYGKREGRTCLNVPQLQGFASAYAGTSYSPVYDGRYYHDAYADLRSAFTVRAAPNVTLFDDAALLRHFVDWGMAEGRQGSLSFNVNVYRSSYPDLRAAFGTNLRAYYMHYITNGQREGRKAA